MILVIADDLTGAAEIAGLAQSRGLQTRLLTDAGGSADQCDVTVVATDTRSMTAEAALSETRRVVSSLIRHQVLAPGVTLFKKTDSALRGHVVAELHELMRLTGFQRSVYLPANPSRGRTIRGGTYYIRQHGRDVPIAETDFSFDPEFPARTSLLAERFPDAVGIAMPDAATPADLAAAVHEAADDTILAGAADLFQQLLLARFPASPSSGGSLPDPLPASPSSAAPVETPIPPSTSIVMVCGSTQSRPPELGIPLSPMPRALYDGATDLTPWLDDALPKSASCGSVILTIPHRHLTGPAVAVHLRALTSRMVQQLLRHLRPDELIIEGGATAFAILRRLRLTHFTVLAQLAPGVVRLRESTSGLLITLKPGSYPWGHCLAAVVA